MRKLVLSLVVLAVLAMVPVAAFAELGVGGAAFYKSPYLMGQPLDLANANANQFSFGGDLRFKLGWFQAEGLVLYSAGDVQSLNMYFDAGVALDVAIVRLSLGVGPNFIANFGQGSPVQAGLNGKIGADIKLGPISFGLSYIMALNLSNGATLQTSSGLLGAQVLFWF
jgi:hypothetical protein